MAKSKKAVAKKVEKQLQEATDVKPRKGEDRQDYLARLANEANALEPADWDDLDFEAQFWANEAVQVLDIGESIAEFTDFNFSAAPDPEIVEDEDEEEPEEKDEDEEEPEEEDEDEEEPEEEPEEEDEDEEEPEEEPEEEDEEEPEEEDGDEDDEEEEEETPVKSKRSSKRKEKAMAKSEKTKSKKSKKATEKKTTVKKSKKNADDESKKGSKGEGRGRKGSGIGSTGISYMVRNPEATIEALKKHLDSKDIALSESTLRGIHSHTRKVLKVINEIGMQVTKA